MPTMPIASAIGMRTKASSIMASRPTSASVISGGRLRGAPIAGHEDLEYVHQAGEADHRRHEIDEGPHRNSQHVGGVAVARDALGLDQYLPGEEQEHGCDHAMDYANQERDGARRQHAVDEIHRHVLV